MQLTFIIVFINLTRHRRNIGFLRILLGGKCSFGIPMLVKALTRGNLQNRLMIYTIPTPLLFLPSRVPPKTTPKKSGSGLTSFYNKILYLSMDLGVVHPPPSRKNSPFKNILFLVAIFSNQNLETFQFKILT